MDTSYSFFAYIMISYQNIWYHLKKQSLVGEKLENVKKLLNLLYTNFYNKVKRIFNANK